MAKREWEWVAELLAEREGRAGAVEDAGADASALEGVVADCYELERDLSNLALALTGHPDRIGPYVLLKPLGRGHSGILYLAEHGETRARAAVRRLAGPDAAELTAAAEASRAVAHPAVTAVHATGPDWIATEPSSGVPLSRILTALGRDDGDSARAARTLLVSLADVADALSTAHRAGVIHSGVSARKIDLRPDGTLRIRDFGFDPTRAGRPPGPDRPPLGPPCYLAPEQAGAGGEITAATDVYSLGAVAFAIAARRAPFAARSLSAVLRRIQQGDVGAAPGWLPAEAQRAIAAAMAVLPEERIGAWELAEALRSCGRAWAPFPPLHPGPPRASLEEHDSVDGDHPDLDAVAVCILRAEGLE